MQNDRKASELLSKSLDGLLTDAEQDELNHALAANAESAKFAALSRLIHESVTEVVSAIDAGDAEVAPALTEAAKSRLRNSVRKATLAETSGTVEFVGENAAAGASGINAGDTRDARTRFTLLRKIGDGGLGTVWLARDEDLKRTVAIKEMLPDKGDSPKHLQRFQREATITGLLEHPNVVPLYMFGVDSELGKPFYAMRFLGKQTLVDAISEYHARRVVGQAESIDLHRLLTVFLDVCQAIAYAHSRGVVHRDLKPENVALDSFGQVIVLDWGIAKLLSDGELAMQCSLNPCAAEEGILTKTMAGEVVGTPMYMAPEQASGDLDSVDERTDVFGLGAILFAILTGHAPHEKSSAGLEKQGVKEFLKVIAAGETPLPRAFNATVSRDLEAICLRAMSGQRYTRHASAQELANDVERWMAGQHEKRKKYESMHLEAHGLRSYLTSCIRDFATNARFMSTLPPIQGLIDVVHDEDQEGESVWRERLSTIFRGLLRSNSDFTSVTYSRVIEGENVELVRVEKPNTESEARNVPKSRLRSTTVTEFVKAVIQKKPDDVHVDVTSCLDSPNAVGAISMRLEAGAPIFDRDEEPFGTVVLEGDFHRLVSSQLQNRNRASARVLVIDDRGSILLEDADVLLGVVGKSGAEVVPSWPEIECELNLNGDYLDPQREIFATRVGLAPRMASLSVVLIAKEA